MDSGSLNLEEAILHRKCGEKIIEEEGLEEGREVETDCGSKRGVITSLDKAGQRVEIKLRDSDIFVTRDITEVRGLCSKSSYSPE